MAGSSIGNIFRVTTFGESHGDALGVVIDGCPPLLPLSVDMIMEELARRRPGQSDISSARKEDEEVQILSGVFEGLTTGTPIAIVVYNRDQRPADYDQLRDLYRPSHADYTFEKKYGIRDHRGGGRASARETVARVMAGAVARQWLAREGISIRAYVSQIAHIALNRPYQELDLSKIESNAVRCPDPDRAAEMIELIREVKEAGDSVGGVISCVVKGIPPGIGEPVFDKLHADLGKAMLSINACKGFDIGSGFAGSTMKGSEHNDPFGVLEHVAEVREEDESWLQRNPAAVYTSSNHSGGIQGGISNGMDIFFRAAFKPVSTIGKEQKTVTTGLQDVTYEAKGRHDPCVLPRAVPIVEAMTAIVLCDHMLRQRVNQPADRK